MKICEKSWSILVVTRILSGGTQKEIGKEFDQDFQLRLKPMRFLWRNSEWSLGQLFWGSILKSQCRKNQYLPKIILMFENNLKILITFEDMDSCSHWLYTFSFWRVPRPREKRCVVSQFFKKSAKWWRSDSFRIAFCSFFAGVMFVILFLSMGISINLHLSLASCYSVWGDWTTQDIPESLAATKTAEKSKRWNPVSIFWSLVFSRLGARGDLFPH